jgi:hypothetical protein
MHREVEEDTCGHTVHLHLQRTAVLQGLEAQVDGPLLVELLAHVVVGQK